MKKCINKECTSWESDRPTYCITWPLDLEECCCGEMILTIEPESGANVPLDRLVMPYAVEQRLRFIDFLLSQYGHVNRSAIMDYFGIGAATATRDFKAYKGICIENIVYCDATKSYYRSNCFKRAWA